MVLQLLGSRFPVNGMYGHITECSRAVRDHGTHLIQSHLGLSETQSLGGEGGGLVQGHMMGQRQGRYSTDSAEGSCQWMRTVPRGISQQWEQASAPLNRFQNNAKVS